MRLRSGYPSAWQRQGCRRRYGGGPVVGKGEGVTKMSGEVAVRGLSQSFGWYGSASRTRGLLYPPCRIRESGRGSKLADDSGRTARRLSAALAAEPTATQATRPPPPTFITIPAGPTENRLVTPRRNTATVPSGVIASGSKLLHVKRRPARRPGPTSRCSASPASSGVDFRSSGDLPLSIRHPPPHRIRCGGRRGNAGIRIDRLRRMQVPAPRSRRFPASAANDLRRDHRLGWPIDHKERMKWRSFIALAPFGVWGVQHISMAYLLTPPLLMTNRFS